MKRRIKRLEKKLNPIAPSKVCEMIIADEGDNREEFERRVEKRRNDLIKKHGISEFNNGTFLVLMPNSWK